MDIEKYELLMFSEELTLCLEYEVWPNVHNVHRVITCVVYNVAYTSSFPSNSTAMQLKLAQ